MLSALAVTAALVGAGWSAGTATAATIGGSDSALTLTLTSAEASALAVGEVGPVLAQLPPSFTPEAKHSLGQTITRLARDAANTEGSTMIIVIEGPLSTPTAVTVGVLP
ncbi:hypothetical protein ACTD5D_15675 [Nocardia takedensis]|uniref:hypothetical protein n=1 Tax=Nocardia takedensis TaxID=259390 RepID=UPI000301FBF6|nr:hypothetical protein [Nocardia takedensis]